MYPVNWILVLMAAAAAQAVSPPRPPIQAADERAGDDVIVTGRRPDRAGARRNAAGYIRAIGVEKSLGQIARWRDPICVRTQGLEPAATDQVDRVVADVARQAGAAVAEAPCRANVLIQFTPDAMQLLASIEKKDPRALAGMSIQERARLRAPGLPIRWWSQVVVRGRDGEPFGSGPPTTIVNQARTPLPVNDDTIWGGSYGSSLISTKVSVETTGVVILVDVPLATGRTLSSVAAHAAFVTLARVSIGAEAPRDSIVSLFRADYAGAGSLSVADRRYLSAVSRMPRDRTVAWQRMYLATAMTKDD